MLPRFAASLLRFAAPGPGRAWSTWLLQTLHWLQEENTQSCELFKTARAVALGFYQNGRHRISRHRSTPITRRSLASLPNMLQLKVSANKPTISQKERALSRNSHAIQHWPSASAFVELSENRNECIRHAKDFAWFLLGSTVVLVPVVFSQEMRLDCLSYPERRRSERAAVR